MQKPEKPQNQGPRNRPNKAVFIITFGWTLGPVAPDHSSNP